MLQDITVDQIDGWAKRLGLARSPLQDRAKDPTQKHHAFLDGVDASFALSTVEVESSLGLDWSWSSQMTNHVQLTGEKVLVRPVDTRASTLRFELNQVEANLDKFYTLVRGRKAAPAMSIVDHVSSCFRAHRALAVQNGLATEKALPTFLSIIDELIADGDAAPAINEDLTVGHRERVVDELRYNRITGRNADLALTMRHAAGMVFQETHAELDSEPVPVQLFGLAPAPKRSTRNRLGAYYTPPGLARTLCDLVVEPHLSAPTLRIVDPSCGSGIFLTEVLRSLERRNYQGQVELFGLDISSSAVEMARFALKHNDRAQKTTYSVKTGDFLRLGDKLNADIVLMNPPFVAYEDLTDELKLEIKERLGDAFSFKPDFSMLFVSLALQQLKAGGSLATLLPAGVLGQTSASEWRSQIVSGNDLDLLAILGDHGLFRDAIVNISALVLRKTIAEPTLRPTMLWASQKSGASSEALRRLRRWSEGDKRSERTPDWSIYQAKEGAVTPSSNWTPRPNHLGDLPEKLAELPWNATVSALFHVEQGIRPGTIGERLIIPISHWEALPKKEQAYFRPVAENKSIRAGQIRTVNMMFYPAVPMKAVEAAEKLPEFFKQRIEQLQLNQDDVVEAIRGRRATNDARLPRLVSKTYVAEDSFAVDENGSFVVVQGSSWIPKLQLGPNIDDQINLLTDYALLLNSRLFFMLLRENGRIVAGGQVEASKSTTGPLPLPNLPKLYIERPDVMLQGTQLRERNKVAYPSLNELDRFAAAAYGTDLSEWNLA